MRKRYRYNPVTKEMDDVTNEAPQYRAELIVMPDIPDFISPVDGSLVHGRKSLAEHNRRNNVTNTADFKNQWERQGKERAAFYTEGKHDSQERREQLHHAIQQVERKSRRR